MNPPGDDAIEILLVEDNPGDVELFRRGLRARKIWPVALVGRVVDRVGKGIRGRSAAGLAARRGRPGRPARRGLRAASGRRHRGGDPGSAGRDRSLRARRLARRALDRRGTRDAERTADRGGAGQAPPASPRVADRRPGPGPADGSPTLSARTGTAPRSRPADRIRPGQPPGRLVAPARIRHRLRGVGPTGPLRGLQLLLRGAELPLSAPCPTGFPSDWSWPGGWGCSRASTSRWGSAPIAPSPSPCSSCTALTRRPPTGWVRPGCPACPRRARRAARRGCSRGCPGLASWWPGSRGGLTWGSAGEVPLVVAGSAAGLLAVLVAVGLKGR